VLNILCHLNGWLIISCTLVASLIHVHNHAISLLTFEFPSKFFLFTWKVKIVLNLDNFVKKNCFCDQSLEIVNCQYVMYKHIYQENKHYLQHYQFSEWNKRSLPMFSRRFNIKGNNKITELRSIWQRESKNSYVYKQTKSVNNRKTVKTVMTLTWYRHF
jgi:hypothetical protein